MPKPSLARILIIADENALMSELLSALEADDFDCECISYSSREVIEIVRESNPDLLLIDTDNFPDQAEGLSFPLKAKTELGIPVIVLLSEDTLQDSDFLLALDDFAIKPYRPVEIVVRVSQVLWRTRNIDSDNLIKHGDLVIDPMKFEVRVAGRLIELSFKEYELLKVLISNRERVLTRQTLLDKVWGYDYYGGDRTVDVHIRRLRSKIEDANHSFIETVRNVGYKFREGPESNR